MAKIPTFNNGDQLKKIRVDSLNKAIDTVNSLELNQNTMLGSIKQIQSEAANFSALLENTIDKVTTLSGDIEQTFSDCKVDGAEKTINYYHKHSGAYLGSCDLKPMFEGEGVFVEGTDLLRTEVNVLHFQGTGVGVNIDPNDQTRALVTINQGGGGGQGGSITASIHGQGSKEIDSINITGPTPGTSINGSQLNLHMPDGRFEGFYSSITDLRKITSSSEPNQSMAFLKAANTGEEGDEHGWVPMLLTQQVGYAPQWAPFNSVGAIELTKRNIETGALEKIGFANSLMVTDNIEVINGNIEIKDSTVNSSFIEATPDVVKTRSLRDRPVVTHGEVGEYVFRGHKDSVKAEDIPGKPNKKKVTVDLTMANALTGTISKTSGSTSGPFNKVEVTGAVGSSKVDNNTLTLELPKQTAAVEQEGVKTKFDKVTKTLVKGNKGMSSLDKASNQLTIDLPYLKAGKKQEAVFEESHNSYAWSEPFDKWDDGFQWNPIKHAMEKRWEGDEPWEDGKPWAFFADANMDDVAGLKFDGNVEYTAPTADDATKVATVKIPHLKGGQEKADGSIQHFDVKELIVPRATDTKDGKVDLRSILGVGAISGLYQTEEEAKPTGANIESIFFHGPGVGISVHENPEDPKQSFNQLDVDTRPYSRVRIDHGAGRPELTTTYDALEIRGSDLDLEHEVITAKDVLGNPYQFDAINLIGFDRFPGTFTSTGTPDYSIDAPGRQSRFVYIAPGTQTENGGVNYTFKEPRTTWDDDKRWNSLRAASPSTELVLKGGWVMNLYTPAQEGETDLGKIHQVFYPVDGSSAMHRSSGFDKIGETKWDSMGGITGKVGEDEKYLDTISFPENTATWTKDADGNDIISVKDQRSKYSRRKDQTEAYQWNSTFENIKFDDPGGNVTKDGDDTIKIKIPDSQAEYKDVMSILTPIQGMVPRPSGYQEDDFKDPNKFTKNCQWGYCKANPKQPRPIQNGGFWFSQYHKPYADVTGATPKPRTYQLFYENVTGTIWSRYGETQTIEGTPWKTGSGAAMIWEADAGTKPTSNPPRTIKFVKDINDPDSWAKDLIKWDSAKQELSLPVFDVSRMDAAERRLPEDFTKQSDPAKKFDIDEPKFGNEFSYLDPNPNASQEFLKVGGVVSTFLRSGTVGDVAVYTQTFYPEDGSGMYYRTAKFKTSGAGAGKLEGTWKQVAEKPKGVFVGTTSTWFWNTLYNNGPVWGAKESEPSEKTWKAPSNPKLEKQKGILPIKPIHDNIGGFRCYTATEGENKRHGVEVPYTGKFNVTWSTNLGIGSTQTVQDNYSEVSQISVRIIKTATSGDEEILFNKSIPHSTSADSEYVKFMSNRQSLYVDNQYNLSKGDTVSFEILLYKKDKPTEIVTPPPELNDEIQNQLVGVWLNDRFGQFKNFFVIEDAESNDIGKTMAMSYRDLWGGMDMPVGLDYQAGHSISGDRYLGVVRDYSLDFISLRKDSSEVEDV